jgi:hypothetical protein
VIFVLIKHVYKADRTLHHGGVGRNIGHDWSNASTIVNGDDKIYTVY